MTTSWEALDRYQQETERSYRELKQSVHQLFTQAMIDAGETLTKDVSADIVCFETKAASGDTAEFTGYGSTWDLDLGGDRIVKGAYRKSIANNPEIPLLWSHRREEPIGIVKDMYEDSAGLRFKGIVNLNVQRGREVHELMRMRSVKAMSIGFKVGEKGFRMASGNVRELTEIELLELSVVTFPMNPGARLDPVLS